MNIEIQQVLTQILGFLLLLWLMKKWAWKPLLQVLDDRREKIAFELAEIKTTKESIGQLQRDYEIKIAEFEKQARLKLQEAILGAEQTGREITNTARKEAENLLVKAKESIDREVISAKMQIRNEVAALAMATAEKIIGHEMTSARNNELVLQYMDELK